MRSLDDLLGKQRPRVGGNGDVKEVKQGSVFMIVSLNDCITDTMRYSFQSAGLIFGIEFESN